MLYWGKGEETIEAFWQDFLREKGLGEDTPLLEAFHFDMPEESADYLLQLVFEEFEVVCQR